MQHGLGNGVLGPVLWRKYIESKFREAMVSASGKVPLSRRRCRGKATIKKVKREEGADRFRLYSVRERTAEVEGEKKTDAHYV